MLARATSVLCFGAGLACGAAALARDIFGWGIGYPKPFISLEFVNIPVAVTLALVLFAAGAVIGRRSPAVIQNSADQSLPSPKPEELTRGHAPHVGENRVGADRAPEKIRDDIGRGSR